MLYTSSSGGLSCHGNESGRVIKLELDRTRKKRMKRGTMKRDTKK